MKKEIKIVVFLIRTDTYAVQKYVIEGTSIPNYNDTVKINILDDMPSSLLQMLRLRNLIGHAKRRLIFKLLTISSSYQRIYLKYDIFFIHQCPFHIPIKLPFLEELMSIIISII